MSIRGGTGLSAVAMRVGGALLLPGAFVFGRLTAGPELAEGVPEPCGGRLETVPVSAQAVASTMNKTGMIAAGGFITIGSQCIWRDEHFVTLSLFLLI